MSKKMQTIKVRDYGMVELNRLAVVCDRFEKMADDKERRMAFDWLFGPYGKYRNVAETE